MNHILMHNNRDIETLVEEALKKSKHKFAIPVDLDRKSNRYKSYKAQP
jgi:ribosomal protein L16/L10AE